MAKLAFLGLGQMGAPMAARLVQAGHDLTVWNRSRDKALPLEERGAQAALTPAEAAKGAEAVFTMLATPDAVAEVLLSDNGVIEGLGPAASLVEMSTIGPGAVRSLAEKLPDGIVLIDAPVLGSIPQAEKGELQIFVGAGEEEFEGLAPLLEPMGTPHLIGPLGSGAAMKLVVNSSIGAQITALAEALRLSDALGLDRAVTLERLATSPLGASVARKGDHITSGSYPPNFKLSLARKDMRLVHEAAEAAGADLPLSRAAGELIAAADEAGLGDLDYSAVVAYVLGDEATG